MPFLNEGQPQNTGGLGRESGLGHSLAQPVGPKWGHLAISGDILSCHSWGGGGCYWHPVGRGRGFCSIPPSAQDRFPSKKSDLLKCQPCRGAGCLLQASLPATFCSTPERPFQRIEVAPQTSLSYANFQKLPSASLIQQVSVEGSGREEDRDPSGELEQRCSLHP